MRNNFEEMDELAAWAEKSGMFYVPVKVSTLLWAADRLRLLESILGEDIDLEGDLMATTLTENVSEERE